MELGISSLGHIVEFGLSGKYNTLNDLLLKATEECLKFSENNDFKVCELIIDPPEIFASENKQKFIDLCNNFSIKKQVHGPFIDMGMCSHNIKISNASVESYIETANICADIGVKVLTIHPGVANFLINSIKKYNSRRLIDATNALLDAIADKELTLCIENMPKNANILLKIDEIEEFFSNMEREDIFFTYDTSHFWTCRGDVEKLWSKFHNIIRNIHIVENFTRDSDTHPALGSGKINFREIFDIINKYNYKGALIIELSAASSLSESIEFIKKYL